MGKRTLEGPHLDWRSSTNTSLGPIYKVNYKCINSFVYPLATFPGAHRALPDVDAMEKVITHPKLARCLSKLLIRSATNQGGLWVAMKRRYFRSAALIKELGNPAVTTAQAKRLDELGLDFQDLLKMNSEPNIAKDSPCLHGGPHNSSLFIIIEARAHVYLGGGAVCYSSGYIVHFNPGKLRNQVRD